MTVQVNVRLDENLLHEIDVITKVLHISRSEWIRMKIAQAIHHDTLNMTEAIALEYAKGRISENELKELLGSDSEDIIFVVKHLKRGKKEIDEMVKNKFDAVKFQRKVRKKLSDEYSSDREGFLQALKEESGNHHE